jgi:hypothetical protein
MPGSLLTESSEAWEVAADGLSVVRCWFDISVTLALGHAGEFRVRISEPFALSRADDTTEHRVDPERRPAEGAPVLALLGLEVRRVEVFKDRRLQLSFDQGWALDVPSDSQHEAWELSGPDGLLIVSKPGGALSIWSPASPDTPTPPS